MSRFTLEINPPLDDVVTERIFDGLSVLLTDRNSGRVTDSRIAGSVTLIVIESSDDTVARKVIEEILDNEQVSGSVSLAIDMEVPVILRGEAWPADPVHDSIIGSFTNMETEGHRQPQVCLYCRSFSMLPLGHEAHMQMRCAKEMDEESFTKPLHFVQKPHESLLSMREAILIADKCPHFEKD
jgi:hypothetical protein